MKNQVTKHPITINSISGGKTSAYMASKYPADYDLFALVCNDDPKCAHPDKKVMQLVNDKLQKYSSRFGECIGTTEHYLTLKLVLDLEQKIGREIIWLRDESFDWWIKTQKSLPRHDKRWCTEFMKLKPIFEWCYMYTDFPVKMRIGYRLDEVERQERFTTTYKLPVSCNTYGQNRQKWKKDIEWRIGDFPLIEDKVLHYHIKIWAIQSGLIFPEDSNCQLCFHKPEPQLRKNFDDAPHIMNWAKGKELQVGKTFKTEYSLEQIEKMGLQLDFNFGTGSGCSSGGCTD